MHIFTARLAVYSYSCTLTLQVFVLESMILLAMSFPCTIPFSARYFMPRATCWEKLSKNLGVTLETDTPGLHEERKSCIYS